MPSWSFCIESNLQLRNNFCTAIWNSHWSSHQWQLAPSVAVWSHRPPWFTIFFPPSARNICFCSDSASAGWRGQKSLFSLKTDPHHQRPLQTGAKCFWFSNWSLFLKFQGVKNCSAPELQGRAGTLANWGKFQISNNAKNIKHKALFRSRLILCHTFPFLVFFAPHDKAPPGIASANTFKQLPCSHCMEPIPTSEFIGAHCCLNWPNMTICVSVHNPICLTFWSGSIDNILSFINYCTFNFSPAFRGTYCVQQHDAFISMMNQWKRYQRRPSGFKPDAAICVAETSANQRTEKGRTRHLRGGIPQWSQKSNTMALSKRTGVLAVSQTGQNGEKCELTFLLPRKHLAISSDRISKVMLWGKCREA